MTLLSLFTHQLVINAKVVQALIKEKANVDWQSLTPTIHCRLVHRVGQIDALIYAGAIPDIKNKEAAWIILDWRSSQ